MSAKSAHKGKTPKRVNAPLTFTGLHAAGYSRPIPVYPRSKKPAGGEGWNDIERSYDYAALDGTDHGIGLQCENVVGLDIDVGDDPALADAVEEAVRASLGLNGSTPVRVGQAPKRMLVARVSEPVAGFDITEGYEEDGKQKQRVLFQLLGSGKQFIVRGIHPDTGQPYTFTTPLPPRWSDLPLVTPEQLGVMGANVQATLKAAGRNVGEDRAHNPKSKPTGKWSEPYPWTEMGMIQAAEALRGLDPDMGMRLWAQVGMALHDGTHGSSEGLAMWDEWSQGGEKYKNHKDLASRWRGFKAGGKVTKASLFKNDWPKLAGAAEKPVATPALDLSDEALLARHADRGDIQTDEGTLPFGSPEWLARVRSQDEFAARRDAGLAAQGAAREAARAAAAFAFMRPVEQVMQAEFAPAEPIIDGLLYAKGLTMFYGKQKEGKSFALMQAMSAASSMVPLWPQMVGSAAVGERFFGFLVPQPVACLMLCAEDHGARLQKRFKEMRESGKLPKNAARFDLMLREDVKKLADAFRDDEGNFTEPGIQILEKLIRQWATVFKVIALDTLATIEQMFDVEHAGKDVKKREYAMGTFYDTLADELGIAIIGTGHMRKGRGKSDDGLSPLDLVNTTGAANAGISHFWALVKLPEQLETLDEDAHGKERMFFATGREIEDDPKLHLRQGEEGYGGLWVNYGRVADVNLGARCSQYLNALEAMWSEKQQPYTAKEIAAFLGDGVKYPAVQQMLNRFYKRLLPWKHWKLVRRLGPGGGWSFE